jgi:hypothetical protein
VFVAVYALPVNLFHKLFNTTVENFPCAIAAQRFDSAPVRC